MKNFLRTISAVFILIITLSSQVFAAVTTEVWNSEEGLKRLNRSQFKNDFYQLVNFYQPQMNPAFCGIATSVILLNATHENSEIPSQKENQIIRPKAAGGGISEFHSYSQLSFFNEETDKIKKREIIQLKAPTRLEKDKEIFDAGISLTDFARILTSVYKFKAQVNHVGSNDKKAIQHFSNTVKEYLNDRENFVVANFDGKILGKATRGHISPLVAYDEESDSILVLDVALHKNKWYWVGLEDLFAAMNTKDGDTYRGYTVISK